MQRREGITVTHTHTQSWLNLTQSPITMLSLANERVYMCITVLAEPKLSTVYRQNKVYRHYHHNISLFSNPALLIYNKL